MKRHADEKMRSVVQKCNRNDDSRHLPTPITVFLNLRQVTLNILRLQCLRGDVHVYKLNVVV